MIKRTLLSGVVLSSVAACASHPPPTRPLSSALAATSAAEEAGASRVPPAALHLAMARDGIDQANRMIDDGMNERAHDLTVRAYNDAQLAIALAHEADGKEELAELRREVDPAMLPEQHEATAGTTHAKPDGHATSAAKQADTSGGAAPESESKSDAKPAESTSKDATAPDTRAERN